LTGVPAKGSNCEENIIMVQRTALAIAAMITAFALVLVGSVAAYLANQSTPVPTPTATAAALATAPGLDPTAVQQAIRERDAAYRQRLQQANDQLQQVNGQLQQAYQKQQELATQLNQAYQQQRALVSRLKETHQQRQAPVAQPRQAVAQPQPTAQPAAPATPTYAVSPDAAAGIALGAAPGATLIHAPDLVSFQGTVAYEVVLDRGTLYIDANSGQLLYNGAAVAVASGSGGAGHHEDGEHEGNGGDD
jgi:uncharacterized membrane protein YkoI